MIADTDRCPCRGSSIAGPRAASETYGACCAPYHRGEADPQTAERLMRSRYSAFAVGDAAYLLKTWHPSTRPRELELDPGIQWRRLDIVDTIRGGMPDDDGEVEFRAFWRVLPAPGRERDGGVLHERSRFRRERELWFYVDGDEFG